MYINTISFRPSWSGFLNETYQFIFDESVTFCPVLFRHVALCGVRSQPLNMSQILNIMNNYVIYVHDICAMHYSYLNQNHAWRYNNNERKWYICTGIRCRTQEDAPCPWAGVEVGVIQVDSQYIEGTGQDLQWEVEQTDSQACEIKCITWHIHV